MPGSPRGYKHQALQTPESSEMWGVDARRSGDAVVSGVEVG